MGILTKYIIKLSVGPMLIGLAGFVIFVSVEILYQLSDLIVRHRVGIFVLLKVLYYYLPYFVALGIPVGILLSIFWVLSQLSTDHELMALQVHGISLKVLIVPFLILSIALSFVTYVLSDRIVPLYNQKADSVISKYVYKRPEVFISENVLTKIDESQYFYVKKYDRQNGILEDVVLFRNEPSEEEIITAKRVVKEKNKWFMYDGKMYRVDKDGVLRFDISFNKVELDLQEDIESIMRVGKTPKDMRSEELKERIDTFKKLGVDPAPWIVELHTRYSLSLGPVIIVLVGIPLSLMFNLKSKSWGVILTFVIVVLYQGSGAWLGAMGKERLVDPVTSAWIPNTIFGVTGALLFLLLDTPASYKIKESLSKLFLIAVLLISSVTFSSQLPNLTVTASSVTYDATSLTFSGDVIATFKESQIQCESLTVYINDKGAAEKVFAYQDVIYRKEDTLIKSNTLLYTFSTEHMLLAKVKGETIYTDEEKVEHKIYFYGNTMQKDQSEYEIERGYLTTCELDHPHYRLQALNVEVKENEYLAAYNAIFYILDIPTIYLPVYFVSLKDGPQPFAVRFGYSKDEGLSFESEYNVTFNDGSIGAKIGWIESGSENGRYAQFDLQKKWKDFKIDSSYYVRQPLDQSEIEYSLDSVFSYSSGISTKMRMLFTDEKSYIYYQISPIKELSLELSRLRTSNSVYWVLPYITLKKISLSASPFSLSVNSFYHRSTVEYSEGSLLDHLKEIDSLGKLNATLSINLPSPFSTFTTSFTGFYEIEQMNFTEKTYLLIDSKLPLKTARFSLAWMDLSVTNNIYSGVRLSINKDPAYRIADVFEAGLTLKPLNFLSFSTTYSRTGVLSNDIYSGFSNSEDESELQFLAKLNVPTTLFQFSTTYDLLNRQWDDLIFKTSTAFKLGSVGFALYSNTVYKTLSEKLYKTDFDFNVSYKTLKHTTEFTCYYGEQTPVDFITNTLTIKGMDFFFMKNPDLKIIYKLTPWPVDLLSVEAKGSFYVDETRHEFSGLYIKSSSRFRISYDFSGADPSFGVFLDLYTDSWTVESFDVTVKKDLHCWGLIFEGQFSADPAFSVEKLAFKFYIKEFPKKSFTVDPVTGDFNMDVF